MIRSSLAFNSPGCQTADVTHISRLKASSIDSIILGIEPDRIYKIAQDLDYIWINVNPTISGIYMVNEL